MVHYGACSSCVSSNFNFSCLIYFSAIKPGIIVVSVTLSVDSTCNGLGFFSFLYTFDLSTQMTTVYVLVLHFS
jgi:hypothetical protein